MARPPLDDRSIIDPHAWVDAHPFRTHVRNLLDQCAITWRMLAVYAEVPDLTVRSLACGRPGGLRVRRLSRRHAEQLLRLDAGSLRAVLRTPVPPGRAREAAAALAGVHPRHRVAELLGVDVLTLGRLLGPAPVPVPMRVELAARAACRAHGLVTRPIGPRDDARADLSAA